eukprot:scaffold248098_cov19-Tisochrysis_lutea.AAC.1
MGATFLTEDESQPAAPRRLEDGTEEHWAHIMSKLAPDGYGRSPAWQRQLIERAAKRIMR